MIAPHWDDLYLPSGGAVEYSVTGSAPNRVLTVEWDDIQHYPGSASGATFEVQLEETTGDIYFLYQDVDFGDPTLNQGVSASVGIQNGTIHLPYSCNEAVLNAGQNIRIYRPTGPTNTPTTGPSPTSTPTSPPSGAWTPIAPVMTAVSRPAGAYANGKFYVLSGEESTGTRPGTVQIFDPGAGTWSLGGQAKPVGVSNVCAAAIGNMIYVPAGYNGTSGVTNLDCWTPRPTPGRPSPPTLCLMPSSPTPVRRWAASCTWRVAPTLARLARAPTSTTPTLLPVRAGAQLARSTPPAPTPVGWR
jgi:hypothetical protein